jgi:glycosyltransferase involved in cell wall biosynthesis
VNDAVEVSVVIPTRNRRGILASHGLRSALGQEDVRVEVVVVDDGSTDGTADYVHGLGDPRLRVVRHEEPRRLAGARNAGIAVARGQWLAFLDDDDLWSPRKLRTQLDRALQEGAAWSFVDTIAVDESLCVLDADDFPDPRELPRLLLTGNHVPGGGSGVIARTELVRSLGGFDEELHFFTDWDLWLRLALVEIPSACPEVLLARLVHPTNMLFRDGYEPVLESLERLLGKHRQVTRADRLAIAEWVAHRYRHAGQRGLAARLYLEAARRYRSPGNLVAAVATPFGDEGIRLASRILRALRGTTHLEPEGRAAPPRPDWLARYEHA